MMIYCKIKHSNLYDIEELLYVKEAQLDKFHQEIPITNGTANDDHTNDSQNLGGNQQSCGRGCSTRGCGRGRSNFGSRNIPTCQLCGKYAML